MSLAIFMLSSTRCSQVQSILRETSPKLYFIVDGGKSQVYTVKGTPIVLFLQRCMS